MLQRWYWSIIGTFTPVTVIVAMWLIVTGCSPSGPGPRPTMLATAQSQSTPTPATSPSTTSPGMPTSAEIWAELLQRTPFPYFTPLPPPAPTTLDGTYARFEPIESTPIPCRRCPDYKPEHGVWKLNLDKGIFRLVHHDTGWKSIASFTVSENRVVLFNDPYCPEDVGTYTWELNAGNLILKVIEDECAIRLRAKNLTIRPWLSCQPPSTEAGTGGQWSKPPGC